jgi:uncharacterized protein YkwD
LKKLAFILFWIVFAAFICVKYTREGLPNIELPAPLKKLERFTVEQRELLRFHNERREHHGMEKLKIDERLCEYAEKHAALMAGSNNLEHSSMRKLRDFCGAEVVGENIAWGQETPESVVSNWMWSPMHRWNILGSSYKKVGFGMEKDEQGRNYWCVVFSS